MKIKKLSLDKMIYYWLVEFIIRNVGFVLIYYCRIFCMEILVFCFWYVKFSVLYRR